MKKAITKMLLVFISIFILAGVIPLSANASTSTSNNKTKIFSYLTNELGFNSAAACGIMANIEKESNFKSNVIIRDSNGLPSGGLCMWNGGRLNNLKAYCSKNGLNYLSIEGQLSYLKSELQKKQYVHIYKYLKNVANNSKGAYNAAHYWCYYFEIPANRSSKSVQRGNSATKSYWPVYGDKDLRSPKLQFTSKTDTYAPGSSVKVKWSTGGADADRYRLYLVKKNEKTGKYDYENSKIWFFGESTKTATISKKYLQTGTYKIYVYACNDITGSELRSENVLSLKIKCTKHDYTAKMTKVPTDTKNGTMTHTCSICGNVVKKALTYADYLETTAVKNLKVKSLDSNAVKIVWDAFNCAEGYEICINNGDKWINLGFMSSEQERALRITGLEPGNTYKLKVIAYKTINGKKVFSKDSKVISITPKEA